MRNTGDEKLMFTKSKKSFEVHSTCKCFVLNGLWTETENDPPFKEGRTVV